MMEWWNGRWFDAFMGCVCGMHRDRIQNGPPAPNPTRPKSIDDRVTRAVVAGGGAIGLAGAPTRPRANHSLAMMRGAGSRGPRHRGASRSLVFDILRQL